MEEAKNGSVIDLANLDMTEPSEKGAVMEIRHPGTNEVLRHDDGRPQTITVVGRDSERFMRMARQVQDKRLQQTMRTRNPPLSAASEKDDIEMLVNATLDWDIMWNGKPAEKSPKMYREVYSNPGWKWLREQVDEFAGNRSNFLKG